MTNLSAEPATFIDTPNGPIVVPQSGTVLNYFGEDLRVIDFLPSDSGAEEADQAEFLLGDRSASFEVLVVPVNTPTTEAVILGTVNVANPGVTTVPNGFYLTWLQVQQILGHKWWEKKGE